MSDKNQSFFTSLEDFKKELDRSEQDPRILDLSQIADSDPSDKEWFSEDYEGQLAVDVYQTKNDIVVKAAVAGIKPEDLDIFLHNDLLTIRGKRHQSLEQQGADYFYKECFWGGFSRSIILPVEVLADKVKASFDDGILTISLPKSQKSKVINVKVSPKSK